MGKGLGYRFITSSIFYFFNKTDFEQCLFEIYSLDHYNIFLKVLMWCNCYFEAKFFRMTALTSFHLNWLERRILYHINEDNNVQAKLSASQCGFCAGVSTETALHDFVRLVEH